MDSEGFIDLLAVCSLEIDFIQLSDKPISRLLFLIDKINQSEGIERIIEKTNNMAEYKQSDSCQLLFKFRMFFNDENMVEKNKHQFEHQIKSEKEFFDLLC